MANSLYQKFGKRLLDIILAAADLAILWPLLVIIGLAVRLSSPGEIIFKQKRAGKNGKVFLLYKFRTMVKGAEKLKTKYLRLNEADGPVFKIQNDPRYTPFGKKLSHTGLDELPQLINILKGEMSLVGPRPLPVDEEAKIPEKWRQIRRTVKPGLACSWLLKGAHNLTFAQWMKADLKDIQKSGLLYDFSLLCQTVNLGLKLIFLELRRKNHFPFLSYPK